MIPDGPLHPVDALVGAAAGLVTASVLTGWVRCRSGARWARSDDTVTAVVSALVVAGALLIRPGPGVVVSALARPDPALALAASAVVVAVVTAAGRDPGPVAATSLTGAGAAAAVWALVPDTEAPLVVVGLLGVGGVLALGPAVAGGGPSVAGRTRAVVTGAVAVAALTGTVGRPDRLAPALVALTAVSLVGVALSPRSAGQGPGGHADHRGSRGDVVDDDRPGTHHGAVADPASG